MLVSAGFNTYIIRRYYYKSYSQMSLVPYFSFPVQLLVFSKPIARFGSFSLLFSKCLNVWIFQNLKISSVFSAGSLLPLSLSSRPILCWSPLRSPLNIFLGISSFLSCLILFPGSSVDSFLVYLSIFGESYPNKRAQRSYMFWDIAWLNLCPPA